MLLYNKKEYRMARQTLKIIEKRIHELKIQLTDVGQMRPGTLSVQYRKPEEKKTPFHQLSYTHKGKSRSEYVRGENLCTVRREVRAYKQFRALTEKIVELSIKASRLRCKAQKGE
jgi:hypothetical protein